MSALDQLFAARVDELVSSCTADTLIFFRGFDIPQVKLLIDHPRAILRAEFLKEDHLDLAVLNGQWLEYLNAIGKADGPLVGFYEELLVIRDLLPRLSDKRILVVENNALAPWVPCCFEHEYALKLFDYWQEESAPEDDTLMWLTKCYGDVKLLSGERALLLPVTPDEENVELVPFWTGEPELGGHDGDTQQIEAGSRRDWEYSLDLLSGKAAPVLFLQKEKDLSPRQKALALAAGVLGVHPAFDELDLYVEKYEYSDAQFQPILKEHWGPKAAFRPLLFYKDPDRSQETETITQGQIVAEIVDQCEMALDEEPFSNVFITAPTGSGKSILFQIPALYLAEKYDAVTIVVSPLIALMNDQVDQLQNKRGISIAACINSTMTIEERSETMEEIRAGQKSLIYLAPELLLTTDLNSFLGGRKVGLMVVDEAHTVTSWGRDFRSDYWYLGDFLKKTRRNGMNFPVLCLTATAVYSGEDDVVNDTIHELGLEKTIIHLGNVRRDNISFDIQLHSRSEVEGGVEAAKVEMTMDRVREYIGRGEKVLAYFPFRSHVDQIYMTIQAAERSLIRRYHGQLATPERKQVEQSYKSGEAMGLLCTKAFGMGIDVEDIRHVVHFAPTGTLSDYVQEVGRAARDQNIQGVAHIDYFPGDQRYVSILNNISEMSQYQLREMLKKLCDIYSAKKRRNLLISAETFEYLFRENDVENRTKCGLMLLAKDFDNKFSFPVLIVRPKAMLSRNYVNVPSEIEDKFLRRYGKYATLQDGTGARTISFGAESKVSDVKVYSSGNTYLVDMAAIWENCYPDRAFGTFKKEFFDKEYSGRHTKYHVAPRARVEIRYADEYEAVCQRVETVINGICTICGKHKNSDMKKFTLSQFEAELEELLGEKVISHEKMPMLMDIFTEGVNESAAFSRGRSQIRILRKRKQINGEDIYFVSNSSYSRLPSFFMRQINQCEPNAEDNTFFRFYPLIPNKSIEIMPLLRLMELMGVASYELRGGEKSEVFIRINDPAKLMRLSNGRYDNGVLKAIHQRHKNNVALLAAFFTAELSTPERWELIEQYFLGNEDYVRAKLGVEE